MFASRLFWKVTFDFAFLLFIISVITFMTFYSLSHIEKSYRQAAIDMSATSTLDRLKIILSNMQSSADDYLHTGLPDKRGAYDASLKTFETEMDLLQKSYQDSVDLQTLRQVRTSVYDWVSNIGDRKINLSTSSLNSEQRGLELLNLGRKQSTARYLETARTLLNSLYQQKLRSVPTSIESALDVANKINRYIIIVNISLAIFAVVMGTVLTRSITNPIERLRDGTQDIIKGVYKPITIKQRDELGALANDFNHMSQMLQHNYSRLTAYSELMTALNKHESLEQVEQTSLQILCLHTGASVGALYFYDNGPDVLKLVSGYALSSSDNKLEYRMGEGVPGQCAAMKQIVEVNDISATKAFIINTGLVSVAPAYILATPILFQDNLLGVIILGSMLPFDDVRKEILNNSVPQVGVAITNAMNLEATKQLSNEVASKNRELNTKNAELQKAYRVKSDFLSNMSHELRTPLNSIIGFTSVLLGPHSEPLTLDQAKAMEKVLKNGKHLLELINDILDFSKIEAGRTPVNLDTDEIGNIISNAMVTIEPMVTSKGVKLIEDVEAGIPTLNTDILKIKQILLNLLSNAAKFTDQGAIVVTARKQGDMVSMSVKDDGIGIEPKNLERVFEEFSQIDSSSSRKYKGTGLGLPIARNYARLLGGDLTVRSEFGKGSIFTLVIPPEFPREKLPKPAAEPPPPKPADVEPVAAQKAPAMPVQPVLRPAPEKSVTPVPGVLVLCIDDDAEVIDLLRRYLVPEGYSVRGASSGEEGIRMAEELHPAVITLDIMMPEKDGWQVLRDLKNNPVTKDIPVIIHSIIENRPLALSLGALEVIAKPSEPKKVLSVVEHACRSKSQPIMIVDDNPDFAESLKVLLQSDGYRAVALNSGEEALKNIESINPSLLFLDLVMPGMDGFSVLKQLRSIDRWRNLPIVVLSGADITTDQRQSLDKFAQQFIEKGQFSKEIISSAIKKVIAPTPK